MFLNVKEGIRDFLAGKEKAAGHLSRREKVNKVLQNCMGNPLIGFPGPLLIL